jgi:tight adherence protein C
MNAWLVLASIASFGAVVVLCVALGQAWAAPMPPQPAHAAPVPPAWRPWWPLLRRLAPALAPWIGTPQRERLRNLLARADLDRAIGVEQFVAGHCVAGVAAGCVVLAVAVAGGTLTPWASAPAALLGALLPRIALRDRIARRCHAILRRLPHDLDLITLSIEAGLNLGAALGQAAQYGPPGPLRDEWQRVLRDVHAGQARHDALRAMAARMALPGVSNLVAALIAAERQGASLAPILRAQAEQRRTERFLRAERMAMEAPVKMLLPLVLCIFPGTFAILLFPIVYQLLQEGVL